MTTPLRALLVGAGHPHLHVLANAKALRAAGVELTLLAPASFSYSGMASAVGTGALPPAAGHLDVESLAARHQVVHHVGRMVDIEVARREVEADDGRRLRYDLVSLNLGSTVSTPGIAVDDEVPAVKPFERLAGLRRWLETSGRPDPARVHVIGGGPTGLEVAGHLALRLGRAGQVHLFDRDDRPGRPMPLGARQRSLRRLVERGVVVHSAQTVHQVRRDHLVVGEDTHPHDIAVVATGLGAPEVVTATGLGDHRGIPVDATLVHVEHDTVYAVGDCARFLPRELPRIGVHGVRQGPVLVASLRAQAAGAPLPVFTPQREALQILDLGDGSAIAWRGQWWAEGRSALLLKRGIDRRWLARYR